MAVTINQKAANIWTARIIPVVLVGIAGYATYVVIVRVCVHYLIEPKANKPKRPDAAIAILIVYCILFLLTAISYFRLLLTVLTNPGFVPRGPQWHAEEENKGRQKRPVIPARMEKEEEKTTGVLNGNYRPSDLFTAHGPVGHNVKVPSLQDICSRDIFTCESDGRPIWCSVCLNWKPDRAHHCREAGRCVRKMDHFCPWVGGVISETSFRFFILFVMYGAVYCLFTLVIMAVFVAEQRKHNLDPHWIAVLVLAAIFSAFLLGMAGSSLQFAILNTTTIENLSRKSKVWQLAVHIPNSPSANVPTPYWTVTYDANGQVISNPNQQQPLASSSRTFAILHSKPGENPWDLGPLRNFKSVMGERWYYWLLPLKQSPCTNHDRGDCQYETGPAVDRMRREVGLMPGVAPPQPGKGEPDRRRRRRRRNRRRRPATEQSMELEEDQRTAEERGKRHHVSRRSRQDSGIDQGDSTVDNV